MSTTARPTRLSHPEPAQPHNLGDYEATRAEFAWTGVLAELASAEDRINIADAAVERHVASGRGDAIAIRWQGKRGQSRTVTYAELAEQSRRFANALQSLGVTAGDRVFSLLGRVPELYPVIIGSVRHQAVFCPLFSAFGPEPIATRMHRGRASVLVTTARLYTKKVLPVRDQLPELKHVLVIDDEAPEGTLALGPLLAAASPDHRIPVTDPETPALLHFTSGTTGAPKGALHVHEAVLVHHATGRFALDLSPGDVYWCTADPGWVTGISYGVIAPLTCGATLVVDEAEFDARRWYQTIADRRVTVWYTAPTAIRMLMKAGIDLVGEYDLSSLRFIGSVGEPLNPEAVYWGMEAFGQPIHDNWWQTETGGIMVANYPGVDVKPGSMGRPMPGIDAAIVQRTEDGGARVIDEPGVEGELAIRKGWPSMFRAYENNPERYAKCFAGDWYLSGDLARRDDEGYFWFLGRTDDVIKSAGHLIGPFEVESVLVEHSAVVEAGVIGKPDPVAGAIVKAFVTLRQGVEPVDARTLIGFCRKRLGPAVAPREIDIVPDLPKTRSGKIMRRLLLARELGLPEGDTSTLEPTQS